MNQENFTRARNADHWLSVVFLHPQEFQKNFNVWLADNTHIYADFERRALQVAKKRDHYSGYTLFEVMRHESVIREVGGEFKINNTYCADCCRLFMLTHPALAGFFQLRERRLAA